MTCNESEAWVTFLWTIENYSYSWQEQGPVIGSPVFRFDSINNGQLGVTGYKNKDLIFYYFLRRQSDHYSESIEVEYDLAILAQDDSVLRIKERKKIVLGNEREWGTEFLTSHEDVTTTGKEAFLSRGTLRIRYRLWMIEGKDVKPVTFFARTEFEVKKRYFLWNIERFSSLDCKVTYTMSDMERSNMILSIQVNKEDEITIFFESKDSNVDFLKFQSFITDTNGGHIDCGKYENNPKEIKRNITCPLPFTKKYLMDHKNEYLKNDVLPLYCKCSWSYGFVLKELMEIIPFGLTSSNNSNPISSKSKAKNAEVSHLDEMSDLKKDFVCLYDEGILSDVKLRTTTQIFQAHKNVLSARSPVFRAMFTTDMKEKIQECVDVPDLEDDTVHRMLLYVYTNSLEGLRWDSAFNLFAAADKYGIVCLKSKCSSFLKSSLCPNKVCDVLVLADMHGDDDLKGAVQNYILKHEEDVYSSDEWKVFAKNNTLAVEIMLLKWNKQ